MNRLLAALAFLTRVPVRRSFDAVDVGRAAILFPVIGAGLGVLQLGVWKLGSLRLPPLLTAVLVVTASVWATRALHLDGLADFADGLGGGRTPEKTQSIMRDSRIGAFGAVAIALLLAVKIAAIDALETTSVLSPSLVLAPALARWAGVPLAFFLPYGRRQGGIGASLTDHVGRLELVGATSLAAVLALLWEPRVGAVLGFVTLVVTGWIAWLAHTRAGGITGDILGANVELCEAAAYAAAAGVFA